MGKRHWVGKGTLCVGFAVLVVALEATAEVVDESRLYPYADCPVCGVKLGADAVVKDYDGREIRFCGDGCHKAFEKDPEKYTEKLNAKIVEDQMPFYPLDTCVGTGYALDVMGDPIEHVYNNRHIRFCCKGCRINFIEKPENYLPKVDMAALGKQKPTYPLDTCVICGQDLGDETIDTFIASRLVRVCGKGCLKGVEKDPAGTLSKIEEAAKAGGAKKKSESLF